MHYLKHPLLLSLLLILVSLYLRTNNLDHGSGFHPDERHIVMTLEKMSWKNLNPNFFAYGSLPFYLGFFASKAASAVTPLEITYDRMFILGRTISIIAGILSILLTGLLAFRSFGNRTIAVIAGLLLSFNVLHIQLSRFFAFDMILTALAAATLWAAMVIMARNYAKGLPLCGVFLGLALATKISALSLFAPIAFSIASAHDFQYRRFFRGASQLLFVAVVALLVFALTEPYALIQFDLFQKQNLEQINMTRGEWRPPYTIQYWNTARWMYALEQMARWSFWWPSFIACMSGVLLAPFVQAGDRRREKWLLLIWIGVSFASIAGLQVKFPRYLLPIYPALAVLGGWMISYAGQFLAMRFPRSLRALVSQIPALVVLIPSALFAFAFHRIYDEPHAYTSASEWIYEHVPRNSVIVGFHWDDKIPLTLPGRSPSEFGYKVDKPELAIYELPDSPEKMATLARDLETADFLAWPTTRITGSLPRVPDEYPRSLRLLRLLYSGGIGFELVHTEKVRPRLLGYEWRNDSLDESFSVYDHPKVMIFKKVEKLPAQEIVLRIESDLHSGIPDMTREELLETDRSEQNPRSRAIGQQSDSLLSLLAWILLIELLGFLAWPVLALLFPLAADRGYLLSKTLGVLVFGFLSWALVSLNAIELSRTGLAIVILIMAAGASLCFSRDRTLYRDLRGVFEERSFAVESLFLIATLALMVIKSWQPEIFWGEKPMDFGMLNYFLRIDSLPPEDPWAAGHTLQYYYLGTFIISLLIRLSGIPSGIGFNMGLVLIATLTITGASALFLTLTRRLWLAITGGVIFFLASNFEVIRLWLEKRIHTFDLFWASSRVLHPPSFAEYPLWSFLFGDLHAHVIVFPVTLLLAGIGASALREWFGDERSIRPGVCALYGAVLGTLFALNTWDCISYSVFSAVLFCAPLIPNEKKISWLSPSERLSLIFKRGIIAVLVMSAVVYPFSVTATSDVAVHWGVVYREEFNTWLQLALFHGHWYLLIAIGAAALLVALRVRFGNQVNRWRLVLVSVLGAIPILLTVLAQVKGSDGAPLPAICIATVIILLSALPLAFPIRRVDTIILSVFGICAGFLLAGSELFFLFDRMNTIFKFYSALGTMLTLTAIGSFLVFAGEIEDFPWRHRNRWIGASPALVLAAPILVTIVVAALINLHAMTTYRRLEEIVRPTLDGTAYLSKFSPDEAALYRWIQRNIQGAPVLLEAQGESYVQFNRVQMNTGLPVVLGWEHHVSQRGVSRSEIQRRSLIIKLIYNAPSMEGIAELLFEHGIELIVVGELERKTYSPASLAKFDLPESGLARLYQNGGVTLYATPFSRFHPNYQRSISPRNSSDNH